MNPTFTAEKRYSVRSAQPINLRSLRMAAGAALVLGCLLAFAPLTANAHTKFEGSTPASGEELQAAPAGVTLRFAEAAQIDALHVVDEGGSDRVSGTPFHPGGDPAVIAVRTPGLTRGSYIVEWQVTADDGHVSDGRFAFGIGVAAPVLSTSGQTRRLPQVRRSYWRSCDSCC